MPNNPLSFSYPGKVATLEVLASDARAKFDLREIPSPGAILAGDNLKVMRGLLDNGHAGSFDLVYIDPPYSTGQTFHLDDSRANAVSQSKGDRMAYSDTLSGFQFLEFIRQRAILLRELLSDHGSFYLHIDYKVGHYVKVILDEVFGQQFFRNDISRIKCNPKNFSRKAYGNIKDMVLFYSKTKDFIWNNPSDQLTDADISRLFKKVDLERGRYTTVPLHAPGETQNGLTGMAWKGMLPPKGRHWRCAPNELDRLEAEGLIEWSKNGNPRRKIFAEAKLDKKKQDIWEYKDPISPIYPTEKNGQMLRDIVAASSSENGLVLDAFCGSGSTLLAARDMGRRFVGIDQSKEAVRVAIGRFRAIPEDEGQLFDTHREPVFLDLSKEQSDCVNQS